MLEHNFQRKDLLLKVGAVARVMEASIITVVGWDATPETITTEQGALVEPFSTMNSIFPLDPITRCLRVTDGLILLTMWVVRMLQTLIPVVAEVGALQT